MEKVVIFGTGGRLKEIMKRGYLDEVEIEAFCDNDEKKWGSWIDNIKIISPKELEQYNYDAIYISSDRYYNDIKRQLVDEYKVLTENIKSFDTYDRKYRCEIKYRNEIAFWEEDFQLQGGTFHNEYYRRLMLDIAEEKDDYFMEGKIVADFGCGPKGSLAWTDKPACKLGIDVLANRYLEKFGEELIKHNMVYVTSSETRIPLPSGYVDCLYTINSLDHVSDLDSMINELLRILKPNGTILASFNLNEPSTKCEPQTLTEELIKTMLLKYFDVQSYRLAYKADPRPYVNFWNNNLVNSLSDNRPAILWIRGKKLGS